MRKAVASLLIGFLGLAVQDYAAPQEGRPAIKQKVKKAAMQAAVHAYVFYHGEPQFSWIEGTSITYATNTPETVLKIDDSNSMSPRMNRTCSARCRGRAKLHRAEDASGLPIDDASQLGP